MPGPDELPTAPPSHVALLDAARAQVSAERAAVDFASDEIERLEHLAKQFQVGSGSWALRSHVAAIAARSQVDLDVPTASNVLGGQQAKTGIKRMLTWYLRHITGQLSELGGALTRFATATATEVERLDTDVSGLRERVAELERLLPDGDPAQPQP